MLRTSTLAGILFSLDLVGAGQSLSEPRTFFREQIGLSEDQIEMIARGKAVAKVLPSRAPGEIVVFSAVFVNAAPEDYVKLAFDMDRLRRLPGYLEVGRISQPPALSDLRGFTLEPGDIASLRNCKPGKCGVQLPADAMQELQKVIDGSGPDVAAAANGQVQKMALELLRRYQKEGNAVLGTYHDSDRPFDVDAQLKSLMARSDALPVYLPQLSRYLLDYPRARDPNVESLFYWEKVAFGFKTTLRLNHAMAYQSAGPRGAARVVAIKQLYASHYFQLALDLAVCVGESGRPGSAGFYLISLKGSTQQGLTGFTGALLRRIIVARTRSTQEKALINVKKALEGRP